jgi:hypothetical protein
VIPDLFCYPPRNPAAHFVFNLDISEIPFIYRLDFDIGVNGFMPCTPCPERFQDMRSNYTIMNFEIAV